MLYDFVDGKIMEYLYLGNIYNILQPWKRDESYLPLKMYLWIGLTLW